MPPPDPPRDGPAGPAGHSASLQATQAARAARTGLAILTLINLFNYLDRYVVSALVESLRGEFHLSDGQAGLLVPGFIIVYMLASPVFGALGDRRARPPLIALGVALWSLATALGGFARGFVSLLLARSAVGIGEAAYGTVSPSLLADYFPPAERGRVFAIFNAAIPIGSAAGYVVGGVVDQHFGWRAAFFVAGVPGLLLAFLAYRLGDPPRGVQDAAPATPEPPATPASPASGQASGEAGRPHAGLRQLLAAYPDLLRNRLYVLTVLGYAIYTFALGGLAFWAPTFYERVRGMSRQDATVQFGIVLVATGFVGTFAGGWLGDALLRRTSQAYLWVSGIATLAAAPAALAAFVLRDHAHFMAAIVVAEVLLFASTGPVNSVIVGVVGPAERATAVALCTLAVHLLGDVPSPYLIGVLSDASSLATAFLILPVAIALGGLVWCLAARHGARRAR